MSSLRSRFTFGDGAVIALALALILALFTSGGQGRRRLEIRTPDGRWQYALPADRVLTFAGSAGPFIAAINAYTITITETHCPDGSCARMGPLSRPGGSIICIPQKIELVILAQDADMEADSVCY
ncbi:MAG: NusG domain II-containing protein [Spirochaetota bacterium]|jgi:hypothetical protein|nr:NusG domain II-containing protein [Spirochaetota bacterium]